MAENPYVNKVEYAGQTLMDLTGDTVTPSAVLNGVTFHDKSGAPQTGNVITHDVYDGLDSTSSSDALSANQGRVLNESIDSKAKRFYVTSSGTNRNAVLHAWMGNFGIRNSLEVGECAILAGVFQSVTFYGVIVKATSQVMMGHLFGSNSAVGFYFRDSSSDVEATSTDFTL